jgi:arginase
MGPSAIRYAGLYQRLTNLGHRVRDLGNLPAPLPEAYPAAPADEPLRYLDQIVGLCSNLEQQIIHSSYEGWLPLVLGGDHSIAIGSVAGSARWRPLGLVWIDAHADFNTPETSPSGNIHGMPLAVLTGRGHPRLTAIGGEGPVVAPEHVALVGVRDLDPQEREALRGSGIHTFTMHEIDRRGIASVIEEAIAVVSAETDGFHVSFDLDVVDPSEAPGVGTPVPGGISYREAHLAMEMLSESGGLRSLDLVEVNPVFDTHNATAELAVQLALSALGKRIL